MNAIFLGFWGKEYTDKFLKIFLPCLNQNLKIIKKAKKNYTLEVWALTKDKNYIKKNKLFRSVNKKINCNFKNIDFILNQGKVNKLNKYELLETISYIFKTSQCLKYKYLWFFYPDQFFSNNFILNMSLQATRKKADLIVMHSQNCAEEKIKELFEKKKVFKDNLKKIYLDNLDKSNKYVDIQYVDKYQYLKVIDVLKNSLIIRSFVAFPFFFKTKNNFEGFRYPFYPSHDEGISNYFAKKNIYFVKNLKFGVVGGTTQILPVPEKYNNSLKTSIISGIVQFNECHLEFSKETFVHGNPNSKKLKERIVNVNKKINLLKHGYINLMKNLDNYPNIKENKLFKLTDYQKIIDLIIEMELKVKRFNNYKLIKYNKTIFDNLLKFSQSKIYKRKINFKNFLTNILRIEDKKDIKYLNYFRKIYF